MLQGFVKGSGVGIFAVFDDEVSSLVDEIDELRSSFHVKFMLHLGDFFDIPSLFHEIVDFFRDYVRWVDSFDVHSEFGSRRIVQSISFFFISFSLCRRSILLWRLRFRR